MNLAVLFGLATMVMPAFAQREAAEEKAVRPNFVFFLVDDLGYMDVGANNPDSFYETPHIDRLAATGMRFTNGYAANPVCSPTRYSPEFWPEAQGFDVNQGGHRAGAPFRGGKFFTPYENPRLEDGPPGEYLTDRCHVG